MAGLRAAEARGAGEVVRAAALAALTEQAPVLAAARTVLAPAGEAGTAFEPEALEDFEREQWSPWVAEGDAFGTGPQTYEQTRHAQRDLAGSGARLVSSHALSRSDAATGTLTDKIKVCKMDVDSNRELAAKYGIRSIPSLIIFKDGEPAGVEIGALSKQQLEEFISTVV